MTTEIQVPKAVSMSMDIEAADKEKLKAVFPQCFTEGKLDIDKLLSLCGEYIDNDFEKYKFEWKGKSECYRIAGKRSTGTLRPAPAESVNFDTTNNMYIEGDNLEVLKLLQTAYYRKVKMIYIDPPYNTGNDFVYEDDFKDPMAKYKEITSQTTKSNPETMGRYHTNWLNMMCPRLRLAANLLRDDGVIFISIDDNEVDNLKKLCNEVFGEENFVGTYLKQSKVGGGSDSKFVVKEHEYCLVYTKSLNLADEMFIGHEKEYLKRYKEQDSKGRYFWDTFARPGLKNPIVYDIIAPDGTIINNGWIHSKERFEKEYADGEVRIISKGNGTWSVQFKQYLNENGKKPRSMTMDFGGSIEGKKDIADLFENEKIFGYPKSVKFISTLMKTVVKNDDIILDFFSGSATTAHAVMQLNAEDGGNRQFIMVQLPEVCDESSEAAKAGYKNICEIGKERIRRAGKKILSSLISSPLRGEDKGEGDKQNLLNLAQNMRHNPTESENKLWQALRNNQLDCKFRRQHQIGNYIVDFVCVEKKLIVECDGGQHNENVDAKRTEFLDQEGFRVLRFWNNEVLKNLDGVLMRIKEVVDNNTLTPTLSPQGRGGIVDVMPLAQGRGSTVDVMPLAQGRGSTVDIGFKVFKLDTSNLIKWDDTPLDSTQTSDLFNRLDGMEKSLKKDRTELDVVYEVMAKLGIPLTYKISELNINNRKVYSIGDEGLILVCLDASNGGITPEDISAMCELAPAKIIAAEEAFKDDVSLSNAYYISKDSGVAIELL